MSGYRWHAENECPRTDPNEGKLPREHEANNGTTNDSGDGLNDTIAIMSVSDKYAKAGYPNLRSQSDSSDAEDLLWIVSKTSR